MEHTPKTPVASTAYRALQEWCAQVVKVFWFNHTVNVNSLCQYVVQVGAQAQLGLIPGAEHDVFEAEAVLNHKLIGQPSGIHYLVHW